jgi:RNA-directed DNA polymerase
MSLLTPIAIRTLQRKLYRKAEAEPAFRFYLIYDKIYREDILRHAYALARAKCGRTGRGREGLCGNRSVGLGEVVAGLREELILKTYRPDPVRRVMIPKPSGGERPLGIPTIRERVVQTAASLRWNRSSRPTSRTMSTATAPFAARWTQSRKCAG